jgi:peptide/nickel transport system substrate-binding protein
MASTDGFIIPKDYYEKVGQDQFMKRPVGTGPYKWHSQVTGSFIKLEATDRHWRDGVPRYKYVTFLIIPEESTRLAMLKTGEADITRISREKIKEVLDAGLKVISKKDSAGIIFKAHMQYSNPVFLTFDFERPSTWRLIGRRLLRMSWEEGPR